MAEPVVEIRGLRKEYAGRSGTHVAVADLDLTVREGEVHGFLGPNGSGKTTTIRMLLGLATATRGEMHLFGQPVPQKLPEVIGRVGAVVESPKFAPNFSGRQNLVLLARSVGVPDKRVDEAIETVGLTGRDKGRYKTYSLGMKQRLAVAATLLKDPRLLILDEPTNGLDPSGIREVREMIRGLGESGVTVLLSSHILAEVQQVCTAASIIGHGRTLASGTVAELLGGTTTQRVVAPDLDAARRALSAAGLTRDRRGRRGAGRGDRPARRGHPGPRRGGRLADRAEPGPRRPRVDLPHADRPRPARRRPRREGRPVIRLVRVELTRLRWRRAVLLLLALAIAGTAAIFVGIVVDTRTKTIDDVVASYGTQVTDEIDRCVRRPGQYGVPKGGDVQTACENQIAGWYGAARLDLVGQRESGSGPALVAILMLVLLLAGTTFVGHDWNTGSMSNQLLFEPRRERVWVAKAIAVALVAAVLSAAVLVAYWTGLWAVASARDLPIPDHAVAAAYKQAVLGTVFVTGAALLGYALTMLLRTTVGSLGLLLAIAFMGIVVVWTGFGDAERFMPWGNFVAFVVGGYTYYGSCSSFDCASTAHLISRSDSAIYFVVVLALVVVPSLVEFRRRDVP